MNTYIVRSGCSFFVDFKKAKEGQLIKLTADQVKRYKRFVERYDEALHTDGAPEAPKAAPAEPVVEETPEANTVEAVLEEAAKPRRRRRSASEGDDA